MVNDTLYCQLRTFSQKIKTYQFRNPMKLTFCDILQSISGFFIFILFLQYFGRFFFIKEKKYWSYELHSSQAFPQGKIDNFK